MWASYVVTEAGVCCLMLFLTTIVTAEGSKSRLEHNDNVASSSRAFQSSMMLMGPDDNDDDTNDDGMEKLGFMDEEDDDDDDGDELAFLDEEDDGTLQEHGEPSKDFIKELLKDENRKDKKKNNEPAQASSLRLKLWRRRLILWRRRRMIYHGTRIVLQQKSSSRYWLDCFSSSDRQCRVSTCPGLYFDASDYRQCSRLFFYIYRHKGRGQVRNGDIVGLYIPGQNRWLGCAPGNCRQSSCPGKPSSNFGFQNQEKWFHCWGEVFRIYARNKRVGAAIMDQDPVAIYFLQQHTWIHASGSWFRKSTCMGTTRPPHNSNFERCYTSMFEIHKR